jgi:hypothetical protein
MKSQFQLLRPFIPAILGLLLAPAAARASIIGFGNFSGFTPNQNDSGSPPTSPSPGSIELITGQGEQRSIFYDTPQDVTQFTASFTYQCANADSGGFAFVLENDPRGASAVGIYSAFTEECGFNQIAKSVGITFDLDDDATGLYTDGNRSTGEASVSPINLNLTDPINVQLAYSGSTLTETLTDTVTSTSFSTTYLVLTSIPSTVGSSTAVVGITADSGQGDQTFSSFQFDVVPEPASLSLLTLGTIGALLRRRR